MSSSVLKWPEAATVLAEARAWAQRQVERPGVRRIGVFGSYVRGNAGVGSDLDLVAIVSDSALSFWQRSVEWDTTGLPVPAEILVYTEPEWAQLRARGGRFARMLETDTVWLAGLSPRS